MTDLIARLTEGIAHRENHGRPDTCPDCLASEHYNFPAILHALKVQEAAEAYDDMVAVGGDFE